MRVPSFALAWILDIQIVKKQHNQRFVVDEHRICVEVQTSHLRCKKHLVEHLSAMSNLLASSRCAEQAADSSPSSDDEERERKEGGGDDDNVLDRTSSSNSPSP
ncbi:hypothetical protein BHM03_00035763 [Ensete ventricosum]|nr:hypothetical protein BHM03_00035763 [Ensete ventricosum]